MKRKRMGIKWLGWALLVILGFGGSLQAADLPKVIDKSNCSQYKDLLVPALYRAVERGDWVVTPGALNFKYKHMDSFVAASAKNANKFDISKNGDLIEKGTGKIPTTNFYGFPFPKIDIKDPKAADKILWNFNFQRYRFMGSQVHVPITWVDSKGQERYAAGIDSRLYMMGRPLGTEIKNPDKVLSYEFQNIFEPMSVKGTNTMSYVYIDQRDNSNFAYVPAIRRIRQTTSTARSDPYMGSDAWVDMNYMWSGKNSTMKWKYVGEKTILVSFTSPNMIPVEDFPDGRTSVKYPYTGFKIKLGYEVPGWKGASWAPAPGTLTYVPRKVWVIEQMPKDPYYNWGLHVNYVDQETYTIWYKEVYDKSGEFRTWVSLLIHYSESPSGKSNTGDHDTQLYIDEKARHATVSARSSYKNAFLYMPASKINPQYFSTNNFLLLSK